MLFNFLKQAPKAELHVHLRGAMPRPYFTELLRKYRPEEALKDVPQRFLRLYQGFDNIVPFLTSQPDLAARAPRLFRFSSFQQFLATYLFSVHFFREIEDFRGLIRAVRAELQKENIVYAEITVSIPEYMGQGIALPDLLSTLQEEARAPGIRLQWIVDLVRNFGPEAGLSLLRQIVADRPESLVAITLGGSEPEFPGHLFTEVYKLARDSGLRLTVHAGEASGPQSVRDALFELGVERIGHGVRAIEDPKVLRQLAKRRIPLEVCPTSNIRTGVYPSYDAHPVKALHDAGVPVTINTDDPSFFETTLSEEYMHVRRKGCSVDDLFEMLRNGFRCAFLPADEAGSYLQQLESALREYRSLP
jgi:adenosine deaminase